MRGGALLALELGSRGWGCPKESGSITGGVKVVTALFEAVQCIIDGRRALGIDEYASQRRRLERLKKSEAE